jgi:hypothetical protein
VSQVSHSLQLCPTVVICCCGVLRCRTPAFRRRRSSLGESSPEPKRIEPDDLPTASLDELTAITVTTSLTVQVRSTVYSASSLCGCAVVVAEDTLEIGCLVCQVWRGTTCQRIGKLPTARVSFDLGLPYILKPLVTSSQFVSFLFSDDNGVHVSCV